MSVCERCLCIKCQYFDECPNNVDQPTITANCPGALCWECKDGCCIVLECNKFKKIVDKSKK